ncbi:hypothetical protein SAMN05428964_101802 [Thalassospira xiamenensis]|uniref:Uncharacterized protein n=1 Tax=Thalassospira xiamenensis TaxID=220697 RepID=A0A285RHU6_9PROT|nr:hypothetical protein SAMN05428964_101802 [Thalassospira xiamenensis]
MGLRARRLVLTLRRGGLDSRVRGNDGFWGGVFHPFVTPAEAGVHGACRFGGGV